MRASSILIGVFLLSGCFLHHASAGEKLSKSVHELNKSTRWGAIGSAVGMVDPSYKQQFMKSHEHWGGTVQVADTEIVHMEVADGHESAISVIAYSWYATESMSLHTSVVRQRWTKEGSGFALISELVIQGDPRLLNKAASGAPVPMADPLSMSGAGENSLMGIPER